MYIKMKNNNNGFIDLSKHEHTMTSVIEQHNNEIMTAQSVPGMVLTLTKLFEEAYIDTPASRRLISDVSKKRTIDQAQFRVYNSFLAGTGNAVC
jgi:hypothetical protein